MNVVFLGPPGVGKGTYASRISNQLGIAHISTGDLIRAESKEKSVLGKRVKEFHDKGVLVPDEIITEMLKKRLLVEKGFILDGYPRTLRQAEMLKPITHIDVVINIRLREDMLAKKLAGRRICKKCGEIYSVVAVQKDGIELPALPPQKEGICDKCGGLLYQRDDDREDVIKDRLAVYREQTAPLIQYYREKGILKDVDVIGHPDIMVPKIIELINNK